MTPDFFPVVFPNRHADRRNPRLVQVCDSSKNGERFSSPEASTELADVLHVEALHLQPPDDLADDAFDREIRAVDDVCVLGDGERGIAPGRIDLVARGDGILQALALAAQRADLC